MSFILRQQLPRTAARSTRLFTTSPYTRKSTTDSVKETVDAINEKVGQAGARGIEKGRNCALIRSFTEQSESATQRAKEAMGMGASDAEGQASQMTGEAKGKAQEMAGEVKGKAQEMSGEMKGTAQEYTGKAKGKADEAMQKAKETSVKV
ncbi:MAG: hypothetical protein Q9163_000093 [Psora crenata]